MYGPLIQVMTLAKFNSLSVADRHILIKASYAGAVAQRKFSNDNERKFLADMKKKGMQINEVDIAPFRAKVRPAIEKEFVEKNGDEWLKRINAIVK
jgi:TRAP-type C4-dicarboxylate transport system substrate-binding protein